jgi:hypothetical protein
MVLINSKYMKSKQVQFIIFKIIFFIFFIYFLHDAYKRSIENAAFDTLIMWSTAVISTPIPSVSIILGLPIKLFLNVPIHITYLLISFLSFFILIHYEHRDSSFVQRILQTKTYSIFILSILSSTILTYLLDSGIEYYTEHKPMQHTLVMIIASTILIGLYVYQVHQLI